MSARILIVDDQPASVKMLAAKLSNEYYQVLTAGDGAAALEAVGRDAPDLVLLDVMMPGLDGYQVCEQIKQNPQTTHIPVVMITALDSHEDKLRGLEAGADDFLTKPVDDTTLFSRVRSLVRLKHMLEQWRLREATSARLGFVGDDVAARDSGTGADIILIDDSTVQRDSIIEALDRDNDRVTVIDDYDASGRIVDLGGDVIVISLSMDSDAPLRLASRLRSLEPSRQTPILLIGDREDQPLFIKALELGVNDYITRPIDEQELLARIRTQVRRKRYQDRLHENFLQHLSMALTDGLTGLHNRHYLSSHLDSVMERMRISEKPVSLLMIDIDHFKQVNDTYGHGVGDEALKEIGQRILRNIRGFDLAARFGGEEFVVVMPDTPLEVALGVADRLCEQMSTNPILVSASKDEILVTLSIGVSVSKGTGSTAETLLKEADEALYEAKRQGRNRVIPAPPKAAKAAIEAAPG
ncbi:MAG: PleD family two-component system response regulator [Alphaproteobacteria bacterium]|jgi:two-component system, cell cycle response regulator|nr:PleD family two-component system response regulator [Alphaproteobacteria bacterium]MBT7943583.1 PleD family two-component system response regulator [Alphaproteobacteria bacterium]